MTVFTEQQPVTRRVVVVYQDALLRDVLVSSLEDQCGIVIVHKCRESEFSPSLLAALQADVVLADRMPESSFLALLNAVINSDHPVSLVSVNLFQDDLVVYRGVRQPKAGISDLISIVRTADVAASEIPVLNGTL